MPRNNAPSRKQASHDWAELGCQMMDARRFPEAIGYFKRSHAREGRLSGDSPRDAIGLLHQIAGLRPQWSTAQFSLGSAYEHLGDFERAREHLQKALQLDLSKKAGVQALRARMFFLEGKFVEALDAADRALAANPDSYVALLVRGKACSKLGRTAEAVESLLRSIEIQPDRAVHTSLLFEMNYLADATPEALYAEASRWNALYAAPLTTQIQPHTNSPDPDRRLRIGYVSPDLHQHTLMKFVPPLFERHDRSQFEIYVYAVGKKSDHISDAVRGMVDHYAAVRGSYIDLATRVREDGIDILVDLAGHTMGPELLAFALKPAPIQVSWIGYEGTTGMTAMDYFLGDPQMPCPGTESCFSEKVYPLPRVAWCFRPVGAPSIAPPPCLERGYLTFGCFNNPKKITRQVVMLWSAILHLAPHSKLLLKYHDVDIWRDTFERWFQEDGIAPERLLFEGPSSPDGYLAAYNQIDIALDPFPYNGCSTTLDALWMGVPVVTLAGRLAVQRDGASILSGAGAGLSTLIANTPEQYLKIALALTAAVREQPEMRASIRQALIGSPWMDEIGFVREVEGAFRNMWRTWCKTVTAVPPQSSNAGARNPDYR